MLWGRFSLLLILCGLSGLLAEAWLEGTPLPRLEFFLLLAFHSGLHCRENQAPPVTWLCGLSKDFFGGGRMGLNALIFLLAGLGLALFRRQVRHEHFVARLITIGLAAGAVILARQLASEGWAGLAAWRAMGRDALCTALVSPLAGWLLEAGSWRPWREDGA